MDLCWPLLFRASLREGRYPVYLCKDLNSTVQAHEEAAWVEELSFLRAQIQEEEKTPLFSSTVSLPDELGWGWG